MTPGEAAHHLGGVHQRTITRLCAAVPGIPAMRVGSAWKVWGPFVRAAKQHMLTTSSVDLLAFAALWRQDNPGAAALMAVVPGPGGASSPAAGPQAREFRP